MEFGRERSLKNLNRFLPRGLSLGNQEDSDSNFASARTSCASAASLPIWTPFPETQGRRSPLDASSSSSSLPFHCLASLHRGEGNIFSIAASNYYVFIGSESRRIHAWKLPHCIEMGHIKARAGQVRAMLAHGILLFTAHADYMIRVWDIPPTHSFLPRKIATLPQKLLFSYSRKNKHTDYVSCMCYNHVEKLLYTGSWDRTIKVWKITEKQCVDSFIAHDGHVNAIVINQENGCVFTASSDGTVKIWRRIFRDSSHNLTMTLQFQQSPVNALALSPSPNGRFLYSGSSDGLINFWEKEQGSGRYNHKGFIQGHQFAVLCLAAIEDLILSGSEDATIRIWKREEGNSLHSSIAVLDGHHGPVRCLAASMETDGLASALLVYSASLDQTFKVWRVKAYQSHKNKLEYPEGEVMQADIKAVQTSPVLSPSWVERRTRGSHFGKTWNHTSVKEANFQHLSLHEILNQQNK